MKILIVSQFNKYSLLGGGEMVVTFQQAKSLIENGHTVAMLTHGDVDRIDFDEETGITFIFAQTLGIAPFGYMPLNSVQFDYINKSLREFAPDLIHSHTMNYLALMAQGFAFKNNVKFLYTTHELPDKLVHFFRYGKALQHLTSFFVNTLVKAFLVNTDKVLAINNASKESTLRLQYKSQIDIVHNGVDIHLYKNLKPNFPTREIKLYFVGGINERKNQQYLIKILPYLPSNFQFFLVGSQDQVYKSKLETLASKLGVSDRIFYTGNIDNQSLPEIIQNYHVFASASIMEVQSVAVIEALAAAKPIVALTNETIDDFKNQKAVTILSQDSSPETFAKAVLEMVCDQAEYLTRANQARQISSEYSKEKAYELNMKSYETTEISKFRNANSYKFSMFAYVLVVGSLYRVRQFANLFGLWR